MYRRQVLAGTALLATTPLGGCLGDDDEGVPGDDDDPFDVDAESLLLSTDVLETVLDGDYEEWTLNDLSDLPIAFRGVDTARDLWEEGKRNQFNDVPVRSGVWLFETVDGAKEEWSELVEPWVLGHGLEEASIGVIGYGGSVVQPFGFHDIDYAYVAFRDANAIGVVTHLSEATEVDRMQAAIDVAQAKHTSWRA